MSPKGKNKPTAMIMFMNKMREQMENEHMKKFKVPFDESLYALCKPFYDKLSEDQKQHYRDMAKAQCIRNEKNRKLTSTGIPVALIEQEEREKAMRKKEEDMEIVNQFNFDINTILPIEIVVIHVNWFCKINENSYVPAEVALARFSLQDGFIDSYHCFPQYNFPAGTKGESKLHSERTHKIPIFGFSEDLKKWDDIFRDIVRFLSKTKRNSSLQSGDCFPLYTMNDDVNDITSRNAVRCFLNLITSAANNNYSSSENPHGKFFKLYSLAKLLSELKKKDPAFRRHAELLTEDTVDSLLRTDMYSQSPGIACRWHDDQDLIPKCSLSRCLSWIFILCNQCSFMKYDMIPGKHIPDILSYNY